MGNSASGIGLALCAIPITVHGIEIVYPTLARFVANVVLPPFTLTMPTAAASLDYTEQMAMLDAALQSAPEEKSEAAKDLLFVMLFESRQGAAGFIAAACASAYAFTIPVKERHPIHFLFTALSIGMAMANFNHATAGLFPFGNHPLISANGRMVGALFTPFWIASTYCNWVGFNLSRSGKTD